MAYITRIVLVILGVLSLIGGVIGAIDSWPEAYINSDLLADAAKTISIYWLASGIVSWAVFWGLAAIIEELALARQSLGGGHAETFATNKLLSKTNELLSKIDKEQVAQTILLRRVEVFAQAHEPQSIEINEEGLSGGSSSLEAPPEKEAPGESDSPAAPSVALRNPQSPR